MEWLSNHHTANSQEVGVEGFDRIKRSRMQVEVGSHIAFNQMGVW